METIKVNMNPNPLDVQTIHASQNDGEARQWGFELHNNGEKIDSSSISDQLVFKAYEGGTEEILPTNGSTPTTSPFIGDIKYPQGLLSDQEFLYRESPTEEDGLAKITDIKGNTLVWNQLVQNGRETATVDGVTFTNNGDNSWNISGTATANVSFNFNVGAFALDKQGIYFVSGCPSGGSSNTYSFGIGGLKNDFGNGAIWKNTPNYTTGIPTFLITNGVTVNFTNVKFIICNLTQMFGTEKAEEIFAMGQTDGIAYFRSLYPLPFYAYNQGTLLSFMGNGIKTVGFNQWDEEWEAGVLNSNGSSSYSNNRIITSYVPILPNTTYSVTIPFNGRGRGAFYDADKNLIEYFNDFPIIGRSDVFPRDGLIESVGNNYCFLFVPPAGATFVRYNAILSYGATYKNDICINISDPSKNGTFEPYTSHTTSLPISTYFPTGMKSAGSVYDELTPTKATTRIGAVDLGSLSWSYNASSYPQWPYFVARIDSRKEGWNNIVCSKYPLTSGIYSRTEDKVITGVPYSNPKNIIIRDSSYTEASVFKQAMQGVYLYYELATPIEISFTTASLVTKNGEVALANENGVLVGKCNSDVSANAGFIEGKIKLSDEDGDVYSNKIQIHVERSPQ